MHSSFKRVGNAIGAGGAFGLGWTLLVAQLFPYASVALILAGVAWSLYVLFTIEEIARAIPEMMLRFVLAVFVACASIAWMWPSIHDQLVWKEVETWNKLTSPVPRLPPPQGGFERVPDTVFTISNDGPLDIGEFKVSCKPVVTTLGGQDYEPSPALVKHEQMLRKKGGIVSFKCFVWFEDNWGKQTPLDINCADVKIQIHYKLSGQSNWQAKEFRFVETSGQWAAASTEQWHPFCTIWGVNGLEPEVR